MQNTRRTAAAIGALALVPGLTALVSTPVQAATPTCHGKPATIVVTQTWDVTLGTEGDDVIVGGPGNDRINGLGGNDTICGRGGTDTLIGGPGDDLLDIGWGGSAAGKDRTDLIDYSDGAAVTVDLKSGIATGQGRDTIVLPDESADPRLRMGVRGSRFADTFIGSARDEYFIPGPGRDTVKAGAGEDRIEEEGPELTLEIPGWKNTRDGADVYRTGAGNDLVDLQDGNVDLDTGSGSDRVNVHGTFADPNPENSNHAPIRGTIRTGPGKDTVRADQRFVGTVSMGSGRDHYAVAGGTSMRLDVGARRFGTKTAWRPRAGGVESWELSAEHGTSQVKGSSRADLVTFTGRQVKATLGRGNDVFTFNFRTNTSGPAPISRIDGGAGTDRLRATGKWRATCTSVERGCRR